MTRGPIVTPEIEALIASIYREHPKWKAPEIRNWVIGEIRRNPKGYFPKGIPSGLSPKWPSLSKVQKELATVRRNLAKLSPKDEPWSIGMVRGDPIFSPDVLPTVLAVCKCARSAGNVFSIRQAEWTVRLAAVLHGQPAEYLWYWTARYAGLELASELIERPFNTVSLDAQLIDPEWKERAADQLKNQSAMWRNLLDREQSGKKYPKPIWEQENHEAEQSKNQSRSKRRTRKKGG